MQNAGCPSFAFSAQPAHFAFALLGGNVKVKMFVDAVIGFGPQRVSRGQKLDLPDGMAQSFIRAGLAEPVEPTGAGLAASIEPPIAERTETPEVQPEPTAATQDKALRPKRAYKRGHDGEQLLHG